MPNFNFDFLKSYNNDLGSFRYAGNGPTTLLAYYDNNSGHDVNSLYGITDWFADMRRDMYRRTQEGEMDESQDRMASSKLAIDLSQALLDDFETMDSNAKDEDKAIARELAMLNLDLMRKNGFWSLSQDPTTEDLNNIIADSQSRYDKELQNYLHNLDQYNESMAAYDISQYYTRKSNEAVTNFSNFFYKLPSVMGTSNTSPALQSASMAAGWAGAKAGAAIGAKTGAGIGSIFGPAGTGIGAGIGTVIGTVGGAVAGAQLGGGMQARQNESHMEAFNGYFEGTIRLATKEGVDLGKVADNVRRQLNEKGVNTKYMDQNQLLEAALSMTDIVTGSAAFDRIASDQFLGTRRIYEKNNALGAGEVVADLSYVLPVGKFIKQGFNTVSKAALRTTDKMLFGNKITNALAKRFSAGLDVAKFGSALRNRIIWDKMTNFATGAALRSAIEGSEEGAQHILVENYLNGDYDDEYANSTFMDALEDGLLLSDLYDNVALRAKSLGAVFNIGQYKNDKQMLEEIMMGALLPFTSPQAMVGASFNAKATYDQIFKSKRIGDYLASAYAEQDDINRTESLYKLIREGVGSSSNYEAVLENARKMLLSADPNTGKINGNIDSTVLTDDNSVPQESDINKFIDQQRAAYQRLKNIKKASDKQLKSLKLDPEDEDLFLALKSNAIAENAAAELGSQLSAQVHASTVLKIAQNKNFRDYVDKTIGVKNESEYAAIAQIVMANEEIDHARNLIDNVDAFANLTKAMKLYGIVGSQAFLSAADSATAYGNMLNYLIEARDDALTDESLGDSVDQDMLKNMYMPTTDVELYTESIKNANTIANTLALYMMVVDLNKGFNTTDKSKALDYVNKYRNARKANDLIADSTNEALREKQDPAQQATVAETKVDDYTTEALEQKRQEDQQMMTDAVSKFKEMLDTVPKDSYVYSLVEQINSRALPFVDDDTSYARNVSRTVNRLKKQYENGLKDSNVSDEDKTRLNNLLEAADNLGKRFDDLLKLNTELKARAERHRFVTPSNSTVWFDNADNRYQLDMDKAEYSENEGLILHLKPVSEDIDPTIDERIKKLQKVRDTFETNKSKADDELKKKLDALISSMDSMIDNLKQMKEDSSKQEIIVRADDPFLNSFYSKDNEGMDIYLRELIQKYVNKVNKNIEQNKADRLKSLALDAVDGDVFIFDINDAKTNRTNAPKYKEDHIEGSNGKMTRATGYPLNTPFGAKQASKLSNPYFAAKYWHGFITMRYVDEAHAKKYFYDKDNKQDYGIVDRKGLHYDRYAAIKLFHKIGEKIATGNLKDSDIYEPLEKLAKNEAKEATVAGVKVTKKDYDNMIGSLPLTAFMYQPHTGKQPTVVVLADFASKNRQTTPSNEEYNGRVDLINNLLLNYKEINKKESTDEELAGLQVEEAEREFGNRVYFGTNSVTLSYSDFDYNTRTKRNDTLNIFTDDAGNQMSNSEINKLYQDRLPDAINQFSKYIDDFTQLLKDLGYNITKEELLAAKDGESILSQLLLDTIKYGDGVIDYKGTYSDRLTSLLGTVTGGKTGVKGRALERAKSILQFTWDKVPEAFISFKNRLDEERRTPSVAQSVEEALRNRYFNGKNSIQITQNGEKIDTTDSDENRAKITKMFQQFEKALRDNKSVTDFMQSLFDAGYSFELDGSKEKANAVIRDYFFNRHFSRLRTPSNIVQALTLGKSTPLNDAVDYENFGRTVEHVQSGIAEVKGLGLVKDENGKYHFSIEKWYDKNVKTKSEEEGVETEYEALVRETNELYLKQTAAVSKMKGDELVKYIDENRDLLPFEDLLRQKKDGTTVLKHKLTYTRLAIKDALEKNNEETLSNLKEKYTKDATAEIEKTDEFDGLKTTPISFAYGSYETDSSGASIIYRDKDGNKHTVSNATGTPGALYMIMPSFLSSARRSVPVKLNPKRFDRPMAMFIAQLLDYVRKGAKVNNFLTTNSIGDFNVSTNVSIQTLLDSLIFTGKDAIRNNPSDRNYASLLYIDADNSVHFGSGDNVLTDDNLEDLVKFIMDNKTYRIDRDKATNHNATFGIDLTIKSNKDSEFGEQDLLDVKSEDNYIAYLIDNEWLLTDLNTSLKSNLFTGPRVHIDYNRKRTFIGIPNDSKSKGSAASARAKLEEDDMATKEEVEVDMEEKEVSHNEVLNYAQKYINKFLDTVTKYITDGVIPSDGIKVAYYGLKSNKIFSTYTTKLQIDNDPNSPNYGSQSLIVEPGKDNAIAMLRKVIGAIAHNGKFALALVDEDNNLIEVDGKPVIIKPAFKGKVTTGKSKGKSSGESDASSSVLDRLVAAIESLASGRLTAPVTSQAASAQSASVSTNTAGPSGYAPLNAPATPATPATTTSSGISFIDDTDTGTPNISMSGDTATFEYNGITVSWLKGDDLDSVLDKAYQENDGMTPEDEQAMTDAYNSINWDSKPTTSGTGVGWGAVPTPATKFIGTKPTTKSAAKGYSPTKLTNNSNITNASALNRVLVEKDGHNIFQMDLGARTFVLANVNGVIIPFYMSSKGTDGKIKGNWYPFFGMTGNWLVKGDINPDGSMSYNKDIDAITKLLNDNLHLDYRVPIKELNVPGLKPYTFKDRFPDVTDSDGKTYEVSGIDKSANGKRFDAIYVEELTGIDASMVVNDDNPPAGFISVFDFIPQILNRISSSKSATTKTAAKPTTTLTFPDWSDVLAFAVKDTSAKGILNNINNLYLNKKGVRDFVLPVKSLVRKYLRSKYPLIGDVNIDSFISSHDSDIRQLSAKLSLGIEPSAKLGSVLSFINDHVQKEDFDLALSRTEKILGKGFNLSILPTVEKAYDKSRGAMVYVFGQCASSGIRLFRDADNRIAKGSMYHEAFHKISLFTLDASQRELMYNDARDMYDEIQLASDLEVEEFLADKFAEFVLDAELRQQGKYYSSNPVYKFFQKMFDFIRSIINRLTSANITPDYVNMNKLFEDMYSGRYAYAKATKNNTELFDKIYAGYTPYLGFKVNNVEIASDAMQYQDIFRDILGRFIRTSNLLTVKAGNIEVDMDSIRKQMVSELSAYSEALKTLQRRMTLSKNNPAIAMYSAQDMDVAACQMMSLISVYKMILQPDVWSEWSKIIKNFVRINFNLKRMDSEDPNQVLDMDLNDEGEPISKAETLQISNKRDSYLTDMFDSSDISMKMLLWSVSQFDPTDPTTGKFTPDGMLQYSNVKQVFRDTVHAIEGSKSISDMLDKLDLAADKAIKLDGDYSLKQLHGILTNPDTNPAIVNRFFTDFVRYVHNYENHTYENTSKDPNSPKYEASVRSGNIDRILENLLNKWKQSTVVAMDNIASSLPKDKSARVKAWAAIKKKVANAVNAINANDISTIENALLVLNSTYGFGISDNAHNDALIVQGLYKDARNKNLLSNAVAMLNSLQTGDFYSKSDKTKTGVQKKLDELFGEKGMLTILAEKMGADKRPSPKTDSMRGPGNTKIYSIGAYNFITRFFNVLAKNDIWLDKLSLNPYALHSIWLRQLKRDKNSENIKVHTKLATILDNNYSEGVADIDITEKEDMLNRFVSIMTGKHPIPSLANKRFAADISGIEFIQDAVDAEGNINSKVIDTFVGYLADEILAISDALYTRRYFITNLNKITGKSFNYKTFSKLTSIEQEELFKNNPEAAKLLRLLVSTYHYMPNSGMQQYVINSNGVPMLRSFHIDLTKGMGYKFRHFKNIGSNINLTTNMVDTMSKKNVFTSHSRALDSYEAYNIANEYRTDIEKMLKSNIAALIERYIELGLISGFEPNVENGSVDIDNLNNNFLPANVIKKKGSQPTGLELYNALALVTLLGMSDTIEFEKLVSGDIGYHKNITSVNKRYSGITSTIQATSDVSTIQNAFKDDRLFNSPTFNSITVNTTKVFNIYKFNGDLARVLGENVVLDIEISPDNTEVNPVVDYTKLLDADGNFTQKALAAPLVKRYIKFRDQGIKTGSDAELAKLIVDDAVNRYSGYLSTDPTDAAVYITAEMYRQLRQREGKWNDVDEAMYNLLENYDRIIELSKTHPTQLREIANTLGISYDTLLNKAEKGGEEYKGWVISVTSDLQATSLKYIYYGDIDGMDDHLVRPTYDKQSYVPMFKIFCDEHQMKDVYDFMMANEIDLLKFESAVKSGASPNMEVFDSEGNIDIKALSSSVVTKQYFDLVGKQLNTDAHEMHQTALLTLFMKIAMTNIQKDISYNLNGHKISGKQMLETYRKILDYFTEKGLRKFSEKFGITTNGIDKTKLMKKLQEIAASQNIPADTLNAFNVDVDGNFIIHPAGIPNARWLESSILSEMGKTIIDTLAPGQALYQASSFGFDNIFHSKHHPDQHLLMPGEIKDDGTVNNRMQVKLSILFFKDILDKAKAEAKKGKLKGYDFNNFYDQRRFILENQELFALSYRVPTQGLNSTLPVLIVDVFPPQRGAIISFPASITTLTGSDFDIDKMFLARLNYEIWNGKMRKVGYAVDAIINGDLSKHSDESLQNMLLDMYQAVLMNREHALASDTPLDVCTAPVKSAIRENDKLMNQKTNSYDGNLDGFWANPIFQTIQKVKNSGSDAGIGPMALNNTFRFHIQASGLKLRANEYLKELGIDNIDRIYDRHGEDILDTTSALINAFVDAVKDNFIGRANVNPYTFDIASFLITTGFGNDVFTFLSQPILRDLAQANLDLTSGKLGMAESDRKGSAYIEKVKQNWTSNIDVTSDVDISSLASVKEMSVSAMKKNLDGHDPAQQMRYLNTFLYLKDLAQGYRDAITSALIDTKKYGISADDIIAFIQGKEQFTSGYNLTFSNPAVLFDNTFLGKKFEKGVLRIFDVFSDVILEFSDFYKNTADELCKQYGVYGRNSKKFLKRVGPRIKAVAFSRFFNEYLVNRYNGSSKPLYDLVSGSNSVPARYNQIMEKAIMNNEGISFFQWVKYNPVGDSSNPQFFVIDRSINDDSFIKSNVQASISELFNSEDADIRQWITDFAVYMFYLTGANDTNAGGLIKTTLYDILPPQHLANIKLSNGLTFNQYIQNYVMNRDSAMSQPEMDLVMRLVALSDDAIIKTVRPGKDYFVNELIGKDAITITKGSYRLRSDNGKFDKFIKVLTGNNSPITYRLGDIAIVASKNGKTYVNPIYYREQSLGYRNASRAAFSVRVDGYIDNDGNIASLLNQNDKSKISSIRNLDEKEFNKVTKSIYGLLTIMDANSLNDLSQYLDDNFNIPEAMADYLDYVVVDASDTVYYLNNNDTPISAKLNNLKNYAEYKGKHFVIVSDASEEIEKAQGTATIIGTVSNGLVLAIVDANPDTMFNAKSTANDNTAAYVDLVRLIESGRAKGRIIGVLRIGVPTSTKTPVTTVKPTVFNSNAEKYVHHSGGADGSDSIWDQIGKEFGIKKSNHYYHGKKTPRGNVLITEEQFERGKLHVYKANKTLNRKIGSYMDLFARNWIQVENSDAVFAIGKFKNGVVDGGTGWAVQMAIDASKSVYVFDQNQKQWYKYSDGDWSKTSTPTLTTDFAGIGSRDINAAGMQAIRDVYNKTFSPDIYVEVETVEEKRKAGLETKKECKGK